MRTTTRGMGAATLALAVLAGACGSDPSPRSPGVAAGSTGASPGTTGTTGTSPGSGSTEAPGTTGATVTAADPACPELVQAAAEMTVLDAGAEPRAVRAFGGTDGQLFTLGVAAAMETTSGDAFAFEDEFDLAASRRTAGAEVAPLVLTVDAVRLGDITTAGTIPAPTSADRAEMAPDPGASICLLHGASGLTTVNSSTERWGTDTIGLLQHILHAQVVVFPDAPLGTGARWTRLAEQEQDGPIETTRWEYELVAVDDRGYEVRGRATVTLEDPAGETAQSIAAPPPDWSQTQELTATGTFDQPFPTEATIATAFTLANGDPKLDRAGTTELTVTAR